MCRTTFGVAKFAGSSLVTDVVTSEYDVSAPRWIAADGHMLAPSTAPRAHIVFERLFRRLAPEVRSSLSEQQLDAIAIACIPGTTERAFDRRISIAWFGQRYYVRVFAGRDRRSLRRLVRDGEIAARRLAGFHAAGLVLLACLGLAMGVATFGLLDATFAVDSEQSRASLQRLMDNWDAISAAGAR